MDSQSQLSRRSEGEIDRLSAYMHGAFLLTGVGVLMLGPLLPLFCRQWHLPDSRAGMLLTAQFAGSFSGAVLLRDDLRKSLTAGSVCMAGGYTALAIAAGHAGGYPMALASLCVGGFGIGQLINTISLISARRSGERRGAALMSLNLMWSAGALLAPLWVGLARGRVSLQAMLAIFAAAAVAAMVCQLFVAKSLRQTNACDGAFLDTSSEAARSGDGVWLLVYFAALLFLYGALENSITGWIAMFAIRYAHTSLAAGAYSTTMLWVGITGGRALALLLRRFREKLIQVACVAAIIVASALLHTAGSTEHLLLLAALLGASLAPFIPVTTSLFLGGVRCTPRQAGLVMAASALGGAVLPLAVGVVSQHLGSLKLALELPPVAGVVLLGLCLVSPRQRGQHVAGVEDNPGLVTRGARSLRE